MVGYTSNSIPREFYAPVAGLRIPENLKETLNLSRGSFVAVNLRPIFLKLSAKSSVPHLELLQKYSGRF
jgi:hypothetical protein